jgi:hypothetical protein
MGMNARKPKGGIEIENDRYPVRLARGRMALLSLPKDLRPEDAALIKKWVDLVAEHSKDHMEMGPPAPADDAPHLRIASRL